MTTPDVVALSAVLMRTEPDLAALCHPVTRIPAETACLDAERLFVREHASSAAVVDGSGRIGLLNRERFLAALAGSFGYGRALHSRTPVAAFVDWDCLTVDGDRPIAEVAHLAISRGPERRYDDLLVRDGDDVVAVTTATLIEAMAGLLAMRSLRDHLTGLANRDLLFHHLRQVCAAPQPHEGVAVVYIDLDGFKAVNDRFGHAVGDRLLTATAQRLEAAARPGELVARLGGDEFAVVVPVDEPGGDDQDLVARLADRFLVAVSSERARSLEAAENGDHPQALCRASVGVALSRERPADADTLLREADLAMYTAKRAGGHRYHTASAVRSLNGTGQDLLEEALAHSWVEPHFQPIVDLATGRTVAVEVLARIRHPRLGLLAPDHFLPQSSAATLLRLDEHILRQAVRQVLEHPRTGRIRHVNVNLSPASLARGDLAEHVLAVLGSERFEASRLTLEIPEDAELACVRAATPQLQRLRSAGVAITLDDVGAGSSSLRHISGLAIDGLKIDRSFVDGVHTNERDQAVVRMLVDLAAGLGLSVTAEGVETQAQVDQLRALRCPFGQGYLLGRPRPLDQALDGPAPSRLL